MNWYQCSPSTDNTRYDNTTEDATSNAVWGGVSSWYPPTVPERPPKLIDMRHAMQRRDWACRASDVHVQRLAQLRSEKVRKFNGLITG